MCVEISKNYEMTFLNACYDIIVPEGGTFSGGCYCENGIARIGDHPCPINGDHYCETCDPGFTKMTNVDSTFCVSTECVCENNSVGVVGFDCAEKAGIICPKKCHFHNIHEPAKNGELNCAEYQVNERANVDQSAGSSDLIGLNWGKLG